jgi:hypothetical protein
MIGKEAVSERRERSLSEREVKWPEDRAQRDGPHIKTRQTWNTRTGAIKWVDLDV